jgi:type IV pilus assembly protein PilC
MKFKVTIRNSAGTDSVSTIEANARFSVYEQVEKGGATVVSIEEEKEGLSFKSIANISFGKVNLKNEQRITFTKNLSAMLKAGLNLSRALTVMEKQATKKSVKEIVSTLQESVKKGSSFHEALAVYPHVFSKLFVAMTKAGEESGTLSDTLEIVSKQMETSEALSKKIKGAMMYPSIILFAIAVIGVLMLIYVVPTLSSTFASFGGQLPLATRVIIAMSDFARNNVLAVFGIFASIIIGGYFFKKSKFGSKTILFLGIHFPGVGLLVQETFAARAARTLSSLLASGVEMLTAIGIAAEVVGDNVFGAVLIEAQEQVKKGEPMSATFQKYSKLYPLLVGEMIAVGEETGKVADMLKQVAQYYENDVDNRTKDLSTIIEPLLMLFIGVFVGVFALAMIAPIYSLSSKI